MTAHHDSSTTGWHTEWPAELPPTGEPTAEFDPVTPPPAAPGDDWLGAGKPSEPGAPPASGQSPRKVAGAVGLLAVGALAGALGASALHGTNASSATGGQGFGARGRPVRSWLSGSDRDGHRRDVGDRHSGRGHHHRCDCFSRLGQHRQQRCQLPDHQRHRHPAGHRDHHRECAPGRATRHGRPHDAGDWRGRFQDGRKHHCRRDDGYWFDGYWIRRYRLHPDPATGLGEGGTPPTGAGAGGTAATGTAPTGTGGAPGAP